MEWTKADRKHVDLNTLSREELLDLVTAIRDRVFPSARRMLAEDAPNKRQATSVQEDMENDMFSSASQHQVEWSTIANMFFVRKLAPMDVKIDPSEDGGVDDDGWDEDDDLDDDLDDDFDDEDDMEEDETETDDDKDEE